MEVEKDVRDEGAAGMHGVGVDKVVDVLGEFASLFGTVCGGALDLRSGQNMAGGERREASTHPFLVGSPKGAAFSKLENLCTGSAYYQERFWTRALRT